MPEIELTAEGVVVLSWNDLVSDPEGLAPAVSRAFGSDPECLGLLIVKDLPSEYPTLRSRLLNLAERFAGLDEGEREKYSDPTSSFSFGWSHGKEIMNGKPDVLKGSYYANIYNTDANIVEWTAEQKRAFPEYYGDNIWPEPVLAGFKQAFEELGQFMLKVGCQVARACQPFAALHMINKSKSLHSLIVNSRTTKGRLLHYYPPPKNATSGDGEAVDACGYHLDHSLLTGLCSALYLSHTPSQAPSHIPSPSPLSGLYIKTRGGRVVKATFPPDCLAFQTGEALELATGGRLCATPHYVKVDPGRATTSPVSRETFALFMQPNVDEMIGEGETFGQFSKRIFSRHYEEKLSP